MWLEAVDVHTAFYQHTIPAWLSETSSLEGVPAGSLGITHVGTEKVHPRRVVYPQLAVVSMGWTWALAQASREQLLDSSLLLERGRRAVDFQPPPCIRAAPMHSLYVDSFLADGLSRE